jgi:vacuolar-type H+-ATPase subunit I/STV1
MEVKDLLMKLNEMEVAKLNIEKEKEQYIIDLKSCQKRLENEKARSDTTQVSLTQKDLELQRSKEVLSAANKQIKSLDKKIEQVKEKKRKLKECLLEYANIKNGKAA